jgi:hypothetical protein
VPLGKLNTERAVPLDEMTLAALDAWTAVRGRQRCLPHPRDGRPTDFLFTLRGARTAQGPSDVATSVLTGPAGPEGVVLEQGQLLAPASSAAVGQTIDGIQCNAGEQVAYHIHAHLTVYVNGALRPIPAGIGIVTPVAQQTANGPFDSASRCYYWLHVHAQDGVIHVESPNQSNYTLGQFFAIWNQPLTADQIGPDRGTLTVFVNGIRYAGNPASIALKSHEDIQVDVGTPAVAAQRIDWSKSRL